MDRTLIEEVTTNAARSLRNALGEWAYESTRIDLLDYWRRGVRDLLGAPVPTDYLDFLHLCESVSGQRARAKAAA